MSEYSRQALIDELRKEIGMRYGVYTKRVIRGDMTERDKDIKINRMRVIMYLVTLRHDDEIKEAVAALELEQDG